MDRTYDLLTESFAPARDTRAKPVKMWTRGVPVDDGSRQRLLNTATLPFIHKHVAAMPDVHYGKGATIGSVIPTRGAIIPAAVGVDIGCGMCAVRTTPDQPPAAGQPVRAALRARGGDPGRDGRSRAEGAARRRRTPGIRASSSATTCCSRSTRRSPPGIRRRGRSARWAAATTSSRSAWTRTTACG